MTKFLIEYEVEAIDLASATSYAYEILFANNADVDAVHVKPKEPETSGFSFGEEL